MAIAEPPMQPSSQLNKIKYLICNYDVRNVADNSLCALRARIDFVQRNEPTLTDM